MGMYNLKWYAGVCFLGGPLNLCGRVIPAACDSPGQDLVVSVIPLTLIPPSNPPSFFHGL